MGDSDITQAGCWNVIGVWGTDRERCSRLETLSHCRNCDIFLNAGRKMFERKPPNGYVAQWGRLVRKSESLSKQPEASIFVFQFGKGYYAIPVKYYVEVTSAKKITRIPHITTPYVEGIVNISGEISLCHSLKGILPGDGETDSPESFSRLMVLEVSGERYVFPVNKVIGHARYLKDKVQSLPSTIVAEREDLFVGSIMHNDYSVAIIDPEILHDIYRLNYV